MEIVSVVRRRERPFFGFPAGVEVTALDVRAGQIETQPVRVPHQRLEALSGRRMIREQLAEGLSVEPVEVDVELESAANRWRDTATAAGVSIAGLFTSGFVIAMVLLVVLAILARWKAAREALV